MKRRWLSVVGFVLLSTLFLCDTAARYPSGTDRLVRIARLYDYFLYYSRCISAIWLRKENYH